MRVVINHILSKEDKDAIENGQKHLVKEFECRILSDIKALANTLSREDEHFFRCLSYLVSINRIEFVATISTKGDWGMTNTVYLLMKLEIRLPLLDLPTSHNRL